MVARDPMPRTRQAVTRLVADVGGPGLDALLECVDADEDGVKVVGRSTIDDLLKGPRTAPRLARWSTITAVIGACEEYSRRHGGRRGHRALVDEGRFDRAWFGALYEEETGDDRDGPWEQAQARYLERIRDRYARVDLEILLPLTDQGEHPDMLLEQVFVPQQVRADPPPVEVPREVLAAPGRGRAGGLRPARTGRQAGAAGGTACLPRPACPSRAGRAGRSRRTQGGPAG